MPRSKLLKTPMIALAATAMLAGCETVGDALQGAGLCPAPQVVIRPSTFCQAYRPVEARADDPAAQPGTAAFDSWWDQLPAKVGAENDARIRGNNEAARVNCH